MTTATRCTLCKVQSVLTEVGEVLEHGEDGLAQCEVSVAAVDAVPVVEHPDQDRHASVPHCSRRVALCNDRAAQPRHIHDEVRTCGSRQRHECDTRRRLTRFDEQCERLEGGAHERQVLAPAVVENTEQVRYHSTLAHDRRVDD